MGPEEVIDTINPIPAMAGQDLSKDEISDKQSPQVAATTGATTMSTAPASAAPSPEKVLRLGFTLDIQPGKIDEYIAHHASSRPEIVAALRGVGIRNLSLWNFENRLFYYCEYVGERDFEEAMEEYAKTPGVEEWEALMHTYQAKIPGTTPESDVWWQKCRPVYHQE